MPLSRINSASIANSAISAADIADGTITAAKIISVANTQITGTLSVANTSITGNIISSQIAPNQVFYGNVDIGLALTSNNTNTLSVGGDIELQKTVTADGDSLGQVVFWNNTNAGAASGTSFVNDVARIKGVMDGTGNNSGGRLEFYTKADGQSNQKVMDMDGAGRITKPLQPAFSAFNNSNFIATSQTPLQFNVVDLNIGSHYNNSTYRFTAPIAGRYFFAVAASFYLNGNAREINLSIRKNGTVYASGDAFIAGVQSNNTHTTANVIVLMELAASDYVDAAWTNASASVNFYAADKRGIFSGYLLG